MIDWAGVGNPHHGGKCGCVRCVKKCDFGGMNADDVGSRGFTRDFRGFRGFLGLVRFTLT